MIEINNTSTWGFKEAINGMRMPYESQYKSDSGDKFTVRQSELGLLKSFEYSLGDNDLKLAKSLIKGGTEHRKFLRMVHVQAEICAPRYWLTELDTYKVGTVRDSSSTMHLIFKKPLTKDDFSFDESYTGNYLDNIVGILNICIESYNNSSNKEDKTKWLRTIKQILPEGFMQKIVWDANYEVLLSIYRQRKNHRLSEWHTFCDWIESLPYMKEFIEACQEKE